MTFPYTGNSTTKKTMLPLTGACSAGTVTVALNVPPGDRLLSLAYRAEGTAKGAVLTITAYTDPAQTAAGVSSAVSFSLPNGAVPVDTTTLAATGTVRGEFLHFFPIKSPLSGYGFIPIYGLAVTVSTTASGGTGNWYIEAATVEA